MPIVRNRPVKQSNMYYGKSRRTNIVPSGALSRKADLICGRNDGCQSCNSSTKLVVQNTPIVILVIVCCQDERNNSSKVRLVLIPYFRPLCNRYMVSGERKTDIWRNRKAHSLRGGSWSKAEIDLVAPCAAGPKRSTATTLAFFSCSSFSIVTTKSC